MSLVSGRLIGFCLVPIFCVIVLNTFHAGVSFDENIYNDEKKKKKGMSHPMTFINKLMKREIKYGNIYSVYINTGILYFMSSYHFLFIYNIWIYASNIYRPLSVCVCMCKISFCDMIFCVCVCVRVHARARVYTYVYMHIHMYVYLYILCVCVCVHI